MRLKTLIGKSKEYVFFTLATFISAGTHFAFSIFAKRIIEPYEYGIYSTCLLLQTYLTYLQLGALNSFNRDYPQLIGAKNGELAKEYRNTTFSFICVVFSVALIITALVTTTIQLSSLSFDVRYLVGYFLCALITVLTVIESFANSRARIDGGFTYNAIVLLLQLVSVPIGILLLYKIGYYAVYITTIISLVVGIILFYKRSLFDISFRIDWKLLKRLLLSGLPLLFNGLAWTVVNSIDKFVILGFLDTTALGTYSIAQNAFSFIVLIPTALSQIFYVNMGREYGASCSVKRLNEVANKFTSVIAVIISFVAIFAFYLVPIFIELVLPKYTDGILSAQILIVGLAIYAPTLVNGNILTILKRNSVILRSTIYLCIFNAILSMLFVFALGRDISSVAYGTAVSYVLRSIVLVYQIKKQAEADGWQLFKSSILAVAVIIIPAVMLYYSMQNHYIGLIASVGLSIVIYLVLYRGVFKKASKGGGK